MKPSKCLGCCDICISQIGFQLLLTREDELRAEGFAKGYEEGLEEARSEEREKTTRLLIDRLIANGMSRDKVIEILGL